MQGKAATNVIEVFARSGTFTTTGGDVFFVGPWDSPIEDEVCDLQPRGNIFDFGLLSLAFRMLLSLIIWPFTGLFMLPQVIAVWWSNFVVGMFQKAFLAGAASLLLSPFAVVASR